MPHEDHLPNTLSKAEQYHLQQTSIGTNHMEFIMSTIYADKYRTTEIYSALVIFNEGVAALRAGDIALDKMRDRFSDYEERLRKSFAFHEQESLVAESNEILAAFGRSFRKMRDMAIILSDSEVEYQNKALNAREVIAIINQHDPKLYERSKDEIINIFESIAQECKFEEEDSILLLSDLLPLFYTCRKQVIDLKQIETLRAEAVIEGDELSTPSQIAVEVRPDINYLHSHLEKVATMGETSYHDALATIDAHLAPIITRVKSRATRAEHAAEKEISENSETTED